MLRNFCFSFVNLLLQGSQPSTWGVERKPFPPPYKSNSLDMAEVKQRSGWAFECGKAYTAL